MPIVDSKQKRLDIPQLLSVAAEDTSSDYSPDTVIAAYIKEMEDPQAQFYRYGNTVFVVHGSSKTPGTGIFRAINADTAKNYLQSSYQFVTDAYDDGFWLLVTEFSDPSLLNLFRMILANPPRKGMGYSAKKMPDGDISVNLTLGPKHKVEEYSELQGMPEPQGMPPQGMPPQGMSPQGMSPQGMSPQGMPPQSMPPQGALQQLNKSQRITGGA